MTGKTSAKANLRARMRELLIELSPAQRTSESQEIRNQLIFPPGARVALFAGAATEVHLLDLLASSPQVDFFLPRVLSKTEMEFLPVQDRTHLKKGPFGILEPRSGTPATELDFIVCPGLAFTQTRLRLGQGGGYYDRALKKFPEAQRIGVCFTCQLLDDLPSEDHDLNMHEVLTPPPARV